MSEKCLWKTNCNSSHVTREMKCFLNRLDLLLGKSPFKIKNLEGDWTNLPSITFKRDQLNQAATSQSFHLVRGVTWDSCHRPVVSHSAPGIRSETSFPPTKAFGAVPGSSFSVKISSSSDKTAANVAATIIPLGAATLAVTSCISSPSSSVFFFKTAACSSCSSRLKRQLTGYTRREPTEKSLDWSSARWMWKVSELNWIRDPATLKDEVMGPVKIKISSNFGLPKDK